ncbi:MAG: 5,10-methylenetetrahydromethanopterin reductase [Hadesarchaea archaeon]|nr:5,10-methylenetetrahydromethanopterin reductase [Hadesarchaea archaeon]
MKLGVEFVPYSGVERLRELAERAERFGFDQIWVSDHYHNRYVHSVLVHLAAVTKKIMLGPGVTNPYLSHPSVIAAAVATLDEISNGRAMLGISAGDPFYLATVGVKHRRPITTVREAIQVIRKLLSEEKVDYAGEIFTCRGAGLHFRPIGEIPIYVGGRKRRMLELSGELADGALLNASHPDDLKECTEYVCSGAKKAGRDPKEVEVVAYMATSIDEDEERARNRAKTVVAFVGSSAPEQSLERHGIPPEEMERVRRKLQAGDIRGAREAVTEAMIDAFSVSGTLNEFLSRVEELRRMGITGVVVGSPIGPDAPKSLELIGRALSGK